MALVELSGVEKRYRVYRERYRSLKEILVHRRLGEWEDHWVLRGVDLEVDRGETLGLIGTNGAGKSTVLKLVAGILVPDRGSVAVSGRVAGLLELGAGFQPEYTGRENVFLNASLLGLSAADIERRLPDIVDFAELHEEIDQPLRTYSSGMFMRLGFAVAIHSQPEVLVVDEVLAVGDEAFQHKCLDWIDGFQGEGGTIVLVSHNLASVRELCTRVAWLDHGRVREVGAAAPVVDAYVDQVRDQMGQAALEGGEGERRGAPAMRIDEVRLVGGDGRPTAQLRAGDPLALEIDYRVNRRLKAPLVGVAIHRNDGLYVYGTNTHVDGVALDTEPGAHSLVLSYPSLPLLAGTYRVTVSILGSPRPGEPTLDSHWQRYVFRVQGDHGDQGLVRLPHAWTAGAPGAVTASPASAARAAD